MQAIHRAIRRGTGCFCPLRVRGLIQLRKNGWSSVCEEIDPSRLRVLPKSRVPQRGLTIRSLSLYASLVEGAEIDTTFYDNRQWGADLKINVLVLPWPFEVRPSQFRPNDRLQAEMGTMSNDFDFFTYEGRGSGKTFIPGLRRLLEEARSECGRISMLILPELALTAREAASVRELLAEHECVLITGVGAPGVSGDRRGSNRVQLYSPGMKPVEQEKHHRWKLDNSQIMQYSLGSSLYHAKAWWEHIDISTRRLSFVRLAPWLNICALICEDLARPDPAGDIVRAVAPNLVVSLLMDGPQLMSRWASRHAATLAEDPGARPHDHKSWYGPAEPAVKLHEQGTSGRPLERGGRQCGGDRIARRPPRCRSVGIHEGLQGLERRWSPAPLANSISDRDTVSQRRSPARGPVSGVILDLDYGNQHKHTEGSRAFDRSDAG